MFHNTYLLVGLFRASEKKERCLQISFVRNSAVMIVNYRVDQNLSVPEQLNLTELDEMVRRDKMWRVKQICVFEHSVMTNFNCACPVNGHSEGPGICLTV